MFSNLRTEQGNFNHLFLPPSMQVFQYQKELIHVTKAPVAFTPSSEGVDVVPVEFRRRFARLKKGDEVEFTRDGVPGTLVKGEKSAVNGDLMKPLSFLQAKLLRFRPIISGPQPCRH
jgi:bifunctional DNA-binding transcriptional regulator/antitoxin component of YhaV-PrlF toxin-antitoxin module